MSDYTGALVAVVVCVVVGTYIAMKLLARSVYVVRHAEVMIKERWGKFAGVLTPGLHFVVPVVERTREVNWRYLTARFDAPTTQVVAIKTDRVDMRETLIDLGKQTVITRDTVQIDIDALCYFRITDPQRAVYSVQNLPDAIELLVQATLRNIIAQMTLDDTFSSREQINSELLAKVQRDSERWGVTLTRVEVFNISPPPDILEAMENQIKAERERRSDVLRADGEREAAVINSRGYAAQLVLQAEGQRAATVLRAKGAAEARKTMALAEAQCLTDVGAAVAPFGKRAVDYLATVEYLNSLARLTSSARAQDKVVLVPSDSVEVLQRVMAAALQGSGDATTGTAVKAVATGRPVTVRG